MAITNDLEKRAEEIREELQNNEEARINLVARVIIMHIKNGNDFITYQQISYTIQNLFELKIDDKKLLFAYKTKYQKGFKIKDILGKIYKICDEKNKLHIGCLVARKGGEVGQGYFNLPHVSTKKDIKKTQEKVRNDIRNGAYNEFLSKQIPILEQYQTTKIINDEIDNRQDLTDEEKKQTKEYTYETRIPLEEKKDKVLNRANGKCEYCEDKEMTFEKENGENYLEIHHIKHYSDCKKEGIYPHTLDNLAVLCPKCHKQIHFGKKEVIEKMEERLKLKRKLEK